MLNDKGNPAVEFKRDFDISELKTTTHKVTATTTIGNTQTAEQKKHTAPMINAGALKHQIVCCIQEFHQAKDTLNLTWGEKLF